MQTSDHRRIAFRCVTIAVLLCYSASPATGEPTAGEPETPWYSGRSGHHRLRHLTITAVFGLGYIASATVLNPMFVSSNCHWCEPPVIDRQVRDAIVWRDPERANLL